MPDILFDHGSRLFEHMRGPRATELVTIEGQRILIRPDGYIAHIGKEHFSKYAGEPTKVIKAPVSLPSCR